MRQRLAGLVTRRSWSCVLISSFISQCAQAQGVAIDAELLFFVPAEIVEQIPAVEAGVVAVVEADADGVAADSIGADNVDVGFAGDGRRDVAAMAFVFGTRTFDAQEFEWDFEGLAVIEGDHQRSRFAVEHEVGGPGARIDSSAVIAILYTTRASRALLIRAKLTRFIDQHDRDAVADGVSEARAFTDQFLRSRS